MENEYDPSVSENSDNNENVNNNNIRSNDSGHDRVDEPKKKTSGSNSNDDNNSDDFVTGLSDAETATDEFEFINPIEICLFGDSGRGPRMHPKKSDEAPPNPNSLDSFLEKEKDDEIGDEGDVEDEYDDEDEDEGPINSTTEDSDEESLGELGSKPKRVSSKDEDEEEEKIDPSTVIDDTMIGLIDDSITSGRWGAAAAEDHVATITPKKEPPAFPDDGQRYIDLEYLREISSQGIVDEGSHRAVAWRVLLGFLPTTQIDITWPPHAKEQRRIYHDLVRDYLDGRSLLDATTTRGRRALRGYHSKKLRNRKMRNKFHQVQRLDYESSDEEDEGQQDDILEQLMNDSLTSFSEHDESVVSELDISQSSSTTKFPVVNHSKIMDRLPYHLREEWNALGLSIDSTTPTASARSHNSGKKGPSPKKMMKVYSRAPSTWSSYVALYVNQLLVPPSLSSAAEGDDSVATRRTFDEFVENAKVLEEIRKDVVRTHPDLYFFLEPDHNLGLRRYAAVERILFLWATLNKGIKYVQGMNEIAATIYFVLANDVNGEWAAYAEPDTYFLFSTLMSEIRDVFIPEFDHSDTGIHGRIYNLQHLLITHDPELHQHLQSIGIDASLYSIRWMTTMLSREFLLPDTIRMWDSMFAAPKKEPFLRYVCATMVIILRDRLLQGDFATCLKLLQDYPSSNVDYILEASSALSKYEMKVMTAHHNFGMPIDQVLQMIPPPPSLIMAFGYPGGIPPMSEEQQKILQRSSSDSNQLETESATRSGLVLRAKKMWTGWGGSNADSTLEEENVDYEPDAIDLLLDAGPLIAAMSAGVASPIVEDFSIPSPTAMAPTKKKEEPAPAPAVPLRSRFWGMRRINSAGSRDTSPNPSTNTPTPVTKTPASSTSNLQHGRSKSDSSGGLLPWMRRGNSVVTESVDTATPLRNWGTPLRARVWNRATSNDNNRTGSSSSAAKIVSA